MKAYYQPTLDRASDWIEFQHDKFQKTPKRPPPVGREVIDGQPGWIYGVNVQGMNFHGYDHIAVMAGAGDACVVTAWKDDPEDMPESEFFARVVTIHPLAPDPDFGGAVNTRQETVIYAASQVYERYKALGQIQRTTLLRWSDFVRPAPQYVRHGIWVPDELAEAHLAIRTRYGWRDWSEGPEPVPQQRPLGLYDKPKGTKTIFLRDTALATGTHAADNELALNETAGTGQSLNTTMGGGETQFHIWTSPSGFPDDAAWPTGTYRCQLDIAVGDADITYGLRAAGTATGHFARVNTFLSLELETKAQTEGLFNGPGLKLATTGSVSWSNGSINDRFEVAVAAVRATNHGNQSLNFTFDADAFADGPWVNQIIESITKVGLQFSGEAVTVNAIENISITAAGYQFSGKTVTAAVVTLISITKVGYQFTGQALNVNAKEFIAIVQAAFDWTGKAVTASNTTVIGIAKTGYGWTGQALTVLSATVITIGKAGLSWSGGNINAVIQSFQLLSSPTFSQTYEIILKSLKWPWQRDKPPRGSARHD